MTEPLIFPVTHTEIQSRFFDTDMLGHISTTSYVQYMELGRLDLLRHVATQISDMPMSVVANLNLDFIGEIMLDEPISVVTWVSHIGSKSMVVNNEIFAGERLAAKGSATMVGFDTTTRKATALPSHWRASIKD